MYTSVAYPFAAHAMIKNADKWWAEGLTWHVVKYFVTVSDHVIMPAVTVTMKRRRTTNPYCPNIES